MYGAIIGDIAGSIYEFGTMKTKEFPLFTEEKDFTDDSVMTLAVAMALRQWKQEGGDLHDHMITYMRKMGNRFPFPMGAYGRGFKLWLNSHNPRPYNSCGNGSAMRVSPCGLIAVELYEALSLAKASAEVTHNHPEGIKGAEATTVAIYMARTGSTMEEIREVIDREYYPMNFTLDEIRDTYEFNETCQNTVPQALMAFFESTSFEDAIRNAISVGGDSDTLAAITGGIAEAYYGVSDRLKDIAVEYLDERLRKEFDTIIGWFETVSYKYEKYQ